MFRQITCILLFVSLHSLAQKSVTHQSLYWVRYYNQLSISKKLTWQGEFDNRRFFENNRQHHLIIHSRLHYKLSPNLDVAVGMAYSRQSPQDPNAVSSLVIPEIRPNQEVNFSFPINKKLTLQQRWRVEERFVHQSKGEELTAGYAFNLRFRYRLQLGYSLSNEKNPHPITAKLSNELMVNAGSNIVYNQFDQNRLYAGVEYGISKSLSAELGYLYWYQQRNTGVQFFERDIMRFTLLHKIKLKAAR